MELSYGRSGVPYAESRGSPEAQLYGSGTYMEPEQGSPQAEAGPLFIPSLLRRIGWRKAKRHKTAPYQTPARSSRQTGYESIEATVRKPEDTTHLFLRGFVIQ